MQKRVVAIHDISCFGKCSLTVALPIISAAGIECAAIPTAVLSTHTGGFSGYTFRDLSEDILPIAEHWVKEGIKTDAVYSGYLGSAEQIELVKKTVELVTKEDSLFIVDPVMADHGKLYGGFPEDFPLKMRKLCEIADIITPNITEAALMLGHPFMEAPHTKEYIEQLLTGLKAMCKSDCKIVLTGVSFDSGLMGAACVQNDDTEYIFSKYVCAAYHGTGDIFTSVLTCGILRGLNLTDAAQIASDFTADTIRLTKEEYPEMTYGVNFEAKLPDLIKALS